MNKMFYIKSITNIKFLFILLSLEGSECSIDGTFSEYRRNRTKPGDDPCNPLYWYPQQIPEYCMFKKTPTPPTEVNIPIPIPIPAPLPIIPPPEVPPIMIPIPGPIPFPIMPLPMPLPFGIPLAPTNPMVPVAGIPLPPPPGFPMPFPPQYPLPPPYGSPYGPPAAAPVAAPYPPPIAAPYPPPYPGQYPGPYLPPIAAPYPSTYPGQYPAPYPPPYPMPSPGMGMVPGLPGIVSPDGGINIMPFSDAYSDILEAHKQKMIRRRMQKLLRDYERPPWKSHRNTRRQTGNEVIDVIHQDKFNDNALD